jgi:hypothetical protein
MPERVVEGPPGGGVTGRPELDGGVVVPLEIREHVVGRLREAAEDRVQRMIRVDGGRRAIGVHTSMGAERRLVRQLRPASVAGRTALLRARGE